MNDVSIHQIREAFGEVTYNRGWGYFENGHVGMVVKKGNKLIGTVFGRAPAPYEVQVEVTDKINSRCSCPVGAMCKHGVAVILQWINKKESFADADQFMASLHEKNKDELLNIIGLVMEEDPFLISRLMPFQQPNENKIDLNAISRRINHSGYGYADYYAVPGMVNELERIKRTADTLKLEGNLKDAVQVYLLLIEKGVELYAGIDDNEGELGDLVVGCVDDCSNCLEMMDEEEKLFFISRIISIVDEEDYCLEAENMLFAVATRDNICSIEEQLLVRVPESSYQRGKIADLLYHLYRNLGLHDESLIAISKIGLEDKDDYLRIAKALMARNRDKEAFKYVREGVWLDDKENHSLDELFFSFLNRYGVDEWTDVKEDEILKTALRMLSSHWDIDTSYPHIKNVFIKMEKYDELISTIKTECRDDIALSLLLYDGHIDEAIAYAISSDSLNPSVIIETAKAAKDKERDTDAVSLTFKAIKKGVIEVDETFVELVKLLVKNGDNKKLKEIIEYVSNVSMAKIMAINLLDKNQEYAYRLLERFQTDLGKTEIKIYAQKLEKKYATRICKSWISQSVNRSHVYYDDVLEILKVLNGIMDEQEFRIYVHDFMKANKGKKKLVEKLYLQEYGFL